MKGLLLWISSLALVYCATHAPSTTMDPVEARMKYLENSVETLARQTMLQQLFVDERTRSEGDSGEREREREREGGGRHTDREQEESESISIY